MRVVKPERLWMKGHLTFTERWVQQQIADDPGILGLGSLILKDKERPKPHAGRLDLLLQDSETDRRYEVEVQLGRTDEAHIVRTIEYWDVERKRYPQYDHCAVLIAEDITSRFLNVINLFNNSIPLIAIQMTALQFDVQVVALVFTTVLDELTRGLVDEDEEIQEAADRAYWEYRASKASVALSDRLLEVIRRFDPRCELKYNKFYIGIARDGEPDNFVIFRPKKNHLRVEPRLKPSTEVEQLLGEAGLDVMEYDKRWGRYRIRVTPDDVGKHEALLERLFRSAHAGATA